MEQTIEQQLELADDMIRCPSISEAVRWELCSRWTRACYLLDVLEDEESASRELDALANVWAEHSTYTS